MNPAEMNYSTYDHELLAIYRAIKFFQHFIEGRELTVATDHKLLNYAFKQKADKATPRQTRHLDWIGQFSTRIVHVAGDNNIIADALSRINTIDMLTIVTTDELATHQLNEDELKQLLRNGSALNLRKLRIPNTDF